MAQIDNETPQPAYEQIAHNLRQLIADGTYPPGSMLPTRTSLASEYKVAGATAAKSIKMLIDEGLAVGRQGRGVFVRQAQEALQAQTATGRASSGTCWVQVRARTRDGDARYVRGDQIVEVWRETVDPQDPAGDTHVIATLAHIAPTPPAGTPTNGNRIVLWTLTNHQAALAALRLVEILIADEPGLILLTNDDEDAEGEPRVEWHAPSRGARTPPPQD